MEERLRLLESVVESVNDAIIITEAHPLEEPGPRITYVNPAFTRMTGYAPEEAIGKSPRLLQGPETDPAATARIREALEREEPARVEVLNYRKDGEPFWVELGIVPIRDSAGRLTHWASVLRETTERRRAEAAARRLDREEAARAEEAEARRRMAAILESITDAFVAVDREWRLTYANPTVAKMAGAEPQELLGRVLWDAIPDLVSERLERECRRAMEERVPVRFEEYRERTDTWREVHAFPYAEGLSLYLRDVTDTKRAEEALRRSEAKFAGIVTIAADAIIGVDESEQIIVFNRGAEEIFGYAADEVLGKPFDIVVPESLRADYRRMVREFGESPDTSRRLGEPGQIFGRRKDGETFPMDASISKVEVDGERIYTTIARDISQQVRAAEELRQSNETLNAIIRASPLALTVLDAEGRIEIWNPAAARIFGWSEEEVLGQPIPSLPDEKLDEHRRIQNDALRGEVVTGLETYRLRKDGARVDVEISTAPLHDADGRFRGTMLVLEDISERKRAEAALQETTERLEAVLRAVPIAVTSLDLEGRVQFWNPAAERIFGWTEEEARGRVTPAVPEDKLDELQRELDAAKRGEPIVGLETERQARDGRRIAVRISTAPLRDGAGRVRGMTSLVEDISERKAVEERQRTLSSVLEATPDFVGTSDAEGNVIYLNRAARRMIGLDAGEDLAGLGLADMYPREAARRILNEAIPAAIRDGSWSGETELQHRDGRRIPISVVIVAHSESGEAGNVEFLSTTARDITEPKQREEALGFLADASELLAATLEYEIALQRLAHIAVPRLADFCMIDVLEDSEAHRVAVAHRDPSLEESMARLRRFSPLPGRAVGAWAAIETGEPELVDDVTVAWIREATRDDEHFKLTLELNPRSIMIVPLVAHGHTLGAMTLAATEGGPHYDKEDIVLAEELARRAALAVDNARLYQQSQRATAVRDQVLRIVAHDLRNPLNTVALSAGLLLEMVPEDRELERRQLDTIQRAVWRANTLIQDLLDVAKSQANTLTTAPEPVDPAWLVTEAVELHRPQAEAKGLRLEGNVPVALPAINGDRNRLLQLFGNLIGNAIKFTDEGEITVSANQEDGMVRFRVRDTGPGIEDEQLSHLFDPFWQAQRAERAGAGLGLAIAQAIVDAHGGQLEVDTEIGKGTTFSFTIPVAKPETEELEETDETEEPGRTEEEAEENEGNEEPEELRPDVNANTDTAPLNAPRPEDAERREAAD